MQNKSSQEEAAAARWGRVPFNMACFLFFAFFSLSALLALLAPSLFSSCMAANRVQVACTHGMQQSGCYGTHAAHYRLPPAHLRATSNSRHEQVFAP